MQKRIFFIVLLDLVQPILGLQMYQKLLLMKG